MPVQARPVRITVLGLASLLCGVTIGIKFDVVGDLYLLEPMVALLALQCVLSRGLGKGFVAPLFLGFIAAGLVTFCGYLIADLVAANEPGQYLKGWGRVIFLIVDSAAFMLLAAHGRQNLWWLALGAGVGGILSLVVQGVPFTQWKLGYGEFAAILTLALAPLFPAFLSIFLILAFGVGCMLADYRSLGAVCLVVVAAMLWQRASIQGGTTRGWLRVTAVAGVTVVVLGTLLWFTQDQYAERRQQSNIGRYVGLVVAWRAISESPLIGYGSWAADERFGRMFKSEVERLDRDSGRWGDLRRSLLPHSQILQAWIEGGLPGLAFFLMYGWGLAGGLRWFAWRRTVDALTPLFLFLLVGGLWNLLASPCLGIMRLYIALAAGVILVAAFERRRAADASTRAHGDSRNLAPS